MFVNNISLIYLFIVFSRHNALFIFIKYFSILNDSSTFYICKYFVFNDIMWPKVQITYFIN